MSRAELAAAQAKAAEAQQIAADAAARLAAEPDRWPAILAAGRILAEAVRHTRTREA